MATKYLLSFRKSERRWRKKYRGKYHHFALNDGETKASSYQRVLREWRLVKNQIDAGEEQERQKSVADSWTPILNRLREEQQHLIDKYGDTETTREAWRYLEQQWGRRVIQASISASRTPQDRSLPFGGESAAVTSMLGDLEDDVIQCRKLFFGEESGASLSMLNEKPALGVAPWEQDPEAASSIRLLSERFVSHVKSEASLRRAGNVSRDVSAFLDTLPDNCEIDQAFSGPILADYMDHVKSSKMSKSSQRDRIATVSQFAVWAFERDYIESIPRLIAAKKYRIEVGTSEVEVLKDDDIKQMLEGAKDRERLYILLGLNCGFTQQDIADLKQDEFDAEAGTITRKRSKTKGHEAVPEVTRLLWPETKKLLRENVSDDSELLIVNTSGKPLVEVREVDGKVRRTDAVAKAMARLRKRIEREAPISFKMLRSTAASKLGEHEAYRAYAQYFLGHAASNVADKHYVKPSQDQFDKAMRWLGKQFK